MTIMSIIAIKSGAIYQTGKGRYCEMPTCKLSYVLVDGTMYSYFHLDSNNVSKA